MWFKLTNFRIRNNTEKNKTGSVRIPQQFRRVCVTIFAVEKQWILLIMSVFVVLLTQCAKRVRLFILPSLSCKVAEYKICVLIVLKFCQTFLLLKIIQRDVVLNLYKSRCKVPVILDRYKWGSKFQPAFGKILKYKISIKSTQWEPKCPMGTDRRTDEQTWRN
jgi:hypothetical protein